MAYELQLDEAPNEGIKRILIEQIDTAVYELTEAPLGKEKAVHNARKTGKRIRAALRLVRDEIGEAAYRRENVYFRDANRRLAALRDSEVLVLAVDGIRTHFADALPADAFGAVRAALVARQEALARQLLEESDVMAQTAAALRDGREHIHNLPLSDCGFETFAPGLARVYRRGRRAMAAAYTSGKAEPFHEWRKRVKDLWHHVEILRPIWPAALDTWAAELHQLSDYLGDAHDLAELRRTVLADAFPFPDGADLAQLVGLIDQWTPAFNSAARALGLRLYGEEPEHFVARTAVYWQAWRTAGEVLSGPSLHPEEDLRGFQTAAPASS